MKRKIFTSLIYFLSLSLGLAFNSASAIEQKDPELIINNYLEEMRVNCGFGVEEFESMRKALLEPSPRLINPLKKEQALISSKCKFPYWREFSRIVEKAKNIELDLDLILIKVEELIYDIKGNECQREEAHEKTKDIYIELEFAPIPKGTHQNGFIGEFTITDDTEIQTTPVTQYQWAKVMKENPARFQTGEDALEVEIDGLKIQMAPNKPVESVPYEKIAEFIKILNEKDHDYEYSLPSLKEYLSVVGKYSEKSGSNCLNKEETCHVRFGGYVFLSYKRIYSITDNVLEFTRDNLQQENLPKTNKILFGSAKILFGSAYYAKNSNSNELRSITKPLYYKETLNDEIGFRLVRRKKGAVPQESKSYNIKWQKKDVTLYKNYLWEEIFQTPINEEELLEWMFERKDLYPDSAVKHTLGFLRKKWDFTSQSKYSRGINLYDCQR